MEDQDAHPLDLEPWRNFNSDGKTVFRNEYAWNEVANVIFLESPVGVGFSYSNTSSDYDTGDKKTTKDSHTFLINWLERFPQHKTRDFFINGESYAGHHVPQLAYTILSNKKITNQTIINLKGIAIGNAVIDYLTWIKGIYDYLWTHALNSDETHASINKYCFLPGNYSSICDDYWRQSRTESGRINYYNIYAPLCDASVPKPAIPGSVKEFDPCSGEYVESYLNTPEVQKALHAISTKWSACGGPRYDDASTQTVLPTVKRLIESGISIWIYSGDTDAVVPVTSSRYSIHALKLPVETSWRPWYSKKEVGGHVVGFKGVVLITVRGAGHTVPSFQPERSLQLISSFLQGNLPPSSSK